MKRERRRSRREAGATVDRREFVVGGAALAVVGGLLGGCPDDEPQRPDGPRPPDGGRDAARDLAPDGASCSSPPTALSPVSGAARVVEVHDSKAVGTSGYDATRVKAMLLAGLTKLANVTDIKQAWAALLPGFTASQRIGIKVNCLNAQLYNSKELVGALIETLIADLGADAQKIWVWDRRTDELTRSKLDSTALKVKVAGTQASTKDLSGPGYESKRECAIDKPTRLSKILTSETDITINVALLKTHGVSGITGALKNVYGCIDNPSDFHANINQYLPAIYRLDAMRKPIKLHITEALKAVIKGDTADYPDSMPGRVLLSADPLALDVHALALVNSLRQANTPSLPAVDASKVKWIDEAAKLNLGTKTLDLQKVTMP